MNNILVLMATYNGEEYISDQVTSIFEQEGCNINLTISDDCSTDNSIRCINELTKKYPRVKLRKNNFKFKSPGQNFYSLIMEANLTNIDYVAFSDQDDIFIKDKFLEQINLIKDKNIVGSSTNVKCFGNSSKILKQKNKITRYDFNFEGAGQGCTFLMKADFFLNFQSFLKNNEKIIMNFFFHDWLVYLFCRANNFNWYFHDKPLVLYRIHNKNVSGNKYSVSGIKLRFQKLLNGWYYNQILIANKLSRKIDMSIPDFLNLNFFNLCSIYIFHGRRKISDRFITFIFFVLNRFLKI